MKKYFLDCGANRGQSMKAFIKTTSESKDYKIICFEPSKGKRLLKKLKNNIEDYQKKGYDIEYVDKAVWTHNKTVTFYDMGSESSTTEKGKYYIETMASKTVVNCVDLAEYILNLPEDAYIELKLDIEGGEYDVVEHLHSTSALKRVDKVYLELHAMKIRDRKIEDDFKLLKQLADFNLVGQTWNGNSKSPTGGVYTREKVINEWKRKRRYKK